MNEVLVDLRKLDLGERIGKDMISVDELVRYLEDALDTISVLNEQIQDMKTPNEPDAFDEWHDRVMVNDR